MTVLMNNIIDLTIIIYIFNLIYICDNFPSISVVYKLGVFSKTSKDWESFAMDLNK